MDEPRGEWIKSILTYPFFRDRPAVAVQFQEHADHCDQDGSRRYGQHDRVRIRRSQRFQSEGLADEPLLPLPGSAPRPPGSYACRPAARARTLTPVLPLSRTFSAAGNSASGVPATRHAVPPPVLRSAQFSGQSRSVGFTGKAVLASRRPPFDRDPPQLRGSLR